LNSFVSFLAVPAAARFFLDRPAFAVFLDGVTTLGAFLAGDGDTSLGLAGRFASGLALLEACHPTLLPLIKLFTSGLTLDGTDTFSVFLGGTGVLAFSP